jgi:hypothetical protein
MDEIISPWDCIKPNTEVASQPFLGGARIDERPGGT